MNFLEKIKFAFRWKQSGIHMSPDDGQAIDDALGAAKVFLDKPYCWNGYKLQEALRKIEKYE